GEPQQSGTDGEAEPKRDVAQIQRIADMGERAGRDERSEPFAPGARDDADVIDSPEPEAFTEGDNGDASQNDDRRSTGCGQQQEGRDDRYGQPAPLFKEPTAESNDQ